MSAAFPEGPAALPPLAFDERTVFRSMFLAYPDALLLVNRNGFIVLANPAATTLLGYTLDELKGLHVDALVPDAIRPRHAAYREAYEHAPRARPMGRQSELVARCKDGSEVIVEIALSPLQEHGLPLVVAAIRGISAYPRVKLALQRARYSEHLAQLGRLAVDARDPQAVLDQAPVTATEALQVETARVFLFDSDHRTLRVASGMGTVPGEELGARIAYRPDTSPGFELALGHALIVNDYASERRFTLPRACAEAGRVSELVVPLTDRGRVIGALAVGSRTAQRFGDDEKRFLESLAHLVATSLQRAESEEALRHAQRLESVGQLTGGIAHDFNNLLTVIQGNLQVLGELPALAGEDHAQQLVGAAARASRRGAELTNQLLAFARRQVLQPVQVDVGTMLHALSDMLRRTLDQHIGIEVEVQPSCPAVLADQGQLESALLNIAINARDAMPGGGDLRFHAAPCEALPPDLLHELPLQRGSGEGFVAISIADSGRGMSDEVKARAFEPFFTTKDAGRGTGLGLSTVYGFVKQSSGAIAIDSAPDAGTTVTLYLPRARELPPHADDSASAAQALPNGLKVLMVEDDADVASVLCIFLDTLGCQATLVSSAEQALSALGPAAQFDLLLTDIALGAGMRGTELAALAQQRFPSLAILLMSGFSAELLAAENDTPPSWELLRKPCTRGTLARAMVSALGSHTPVKGVPVKSTPAKGVPGAADH
jgi:PAS domain S-box-containing protein